MPGVRDVIATVSLESGLTAIISSSPDVKLLCIARFVRLFAYGMSFLILVHFLTSLDIPDARVGLFMTMTLLGDVVISFCLTLITDKVGRRRVLVVGAGLMVMSGLVFSLTSEYWLLLFASVIGVISPSGNEIGPFKAVEESILTQLSEKNVRSDIFAWYTLFGTLGAGLGTITCGFAVSSLHNLQSWTTLAAYRVVFVVYALLGLVKLLLTLMLSRSVELETVYTPVRDDVMELDVEGLLSDASDDEDNGATTDRPKKSPSRLPLPSSGNTGLWKTLSALMPTISPQSRSIVFKLVCLFTLDSFASGLASPSWLTYYFTTVHRLPNQALGTLFFVTNILATVSNLLALPIARRLGPLKTMTFTHLPSAIFLGLVPLPSATPSGTWMSMGFLALRACTQSMDQAPRQAFIGAAVLPAERTAILGVVNIAKTFAQAGGIGSTGVLAGAKLWIIIFTGAGALKASYDLLMLWMFLGMKDREELSSR